MKKLTLQEAIDQLSLIQNNPNVLHGTLYSIQDVLILLMSIDEKTAEEKIKYSRLELLENLQFEMKSFVEENLNDLVDFDDMEFEINGNEISATHVCYESRKGDYAINNFCENWLDERDLFGVNVEIEEENN